MKDWKGFALSVCAGVIMAGGLSAAVATSKIAAVRVELRAEIREVELDQDSTFAAVQLLAVAMARVEEQLKAANDKLDNLAR